MTKTWRRTTIGDVCLIRPPKREARSLLAGDEFISFVPMNALGISEKDFVSYKTRALDEVYSGYTYFAENDVLMAKITPCFQNGKLGIARGLFNGVGFGSSEFFVLRCSELLIPEYLFYFLSRESFRNTGITQMSGAVGHQRVPLEFVESYPLPLPPVPEQQRIVAILDQAFAAIETATKNTEKNLANAKELFDSQLNGVFTRQGSGWVRHRMGELTTKIGSGATPKGGSNSYKNEGISLIRSLNVYDRSFKREKLAFIDDEQARKLSNVVLEEDDVLFNITGASIARCCVIPREVLPARVNQHVSILRTKTDQLSAYFLCYLMTSKPYKDFLLGIGGAGGSTRQAITKTQLQELSLVIPSDLQEQDQIVLALDRVLLETQNLQSIYSKSLGNLAKLKQSILHKAFAGELTADPKSADHALSEAGV